MGYSHPLECPSMILASWCLYIRVGEYNQQNSALVMICYLQGELLKDIALLSSSTPLSCTPMQTSCHVLKRGPCDKDLRALANNR